MYLLTNTLFISFIHLPLSWAHFLFKLTCVWLYVCECVLHSAVGEPGGRRSGTSRGNQRGTERAPGPNQWLPVSGLAPPEQRPDESQRHQWDHEHRETLHQTPQGHLWGTKHVHTHTVHTHTLMLQGMLWYQRDREKSNGKEWMSGRV